MCAYCYQSIRIMAFRNVPWCCENHRKAIAAEAAVLHGIRAW